MITINPDRLSFRGPRMLFHFFAPVWRTGLFGWWHIIGPDILDLLL
jgi:hypothetical protein